MKNMFCENYRLQILLFLFFLLFTIYLYVRMFLYSSCFVSTDSMSPTLKKGDFIIVALDVPGYREWNVKENGEYAILRNGSNNKIKVGDVIVFNYPYSKNNNRMILSNDSLYCKRCVATPGSTYKCFFNNEVHSIYLPDCNDTISLNKHNIELYSKSIEFETNEKISYLKGKVYLGDSVIYNYCFKKKYYFVCGDNKENSYDSRSWGMLPEDFILGTGKYIWFSKDIHIGMVRWSRMFKAI